MSDNMKIYVKLFITSAIKDILKCVGYFLTKSLDSVIHFTKLKIYHGRSQYTILLCTLYISYNVLFIMNFQATWFLLAIYVKLELNLKGLETKKI